ncbi:sensor histidine kinase [Streptomyces sp. NPDC054784]
MPPYPRVRRSVFHLLGQWRRRATGASARVWAGEGALVVAVAVLEWTADGHAFDVRSVAGAVGGALLVAAVLPLRRLLPVVTLYVCAVLGAWSALPFATPVMVYGAARRITADGPSPWRRSPSFVVPSATAVAFVLTAVRGVWQSRQLVPSTFVWVAAVTLLFLLAPAVGGVLVGQRQRLLRTLRERNHHLERASRLAESRARLRERARIAQEMHDLLGHRLTLISLYSGAMEVSTSRESPRLSGEAALIASTARTAMGELRDLLGVLRDDQAVRTVQAEAGAARAVGGTDAAGVVAGAAGSDATGTEEDVRALVDASRRAGLAVRLDWAEDGSPAPSPVVRRAVHRLVRESLTNIHKHAPDTSGVEVEVRIDRAAVRLEVRNGGAVRGAEGSGTAPPDEVRQGTGSGLVGLQERVRLLGGTLTSGPRPGGGFAVTARIPLGAAAAPTVGGDRTDSLDDPGPEDGGLVNDRGGTAPPAAAWRTGRGPGLLGCGALLLVVIVGLAAAGFWMREQIRETGANNHRYERVRTGMERAEVEAVLGREPGADVRRELRADEPPRPEGADCLYRMGRDDDGALSYRFCFRDGRLVEKRSYRTAAEKR